MLDILHSNCLSSRVGEHGIDPDRLSPGSALGQAAASITRALATSRGTGWERWRNLPFDMREDHVRAVRSEVERAGDVRNLVVLGIGGSALGNLALQAALNPPTWNLTESPRLFVLDNVDPVLFERTLAFCEADGGLDHTLFNVISKSGETAETAAQFMIVRDRLVRTFGADHARRVVAITDPEKGTMRRICDENGYATLPVPDGVGGRFSVLSPVGLFSAAMCGIDIDALLDGAASMDQRCTSESIDENPAALLATILVEMGERKGKTNHVMMPYANALYLMADWFRQLWAESLGKIVDSPSGMNYTGYTPIKALGATDQHSQIQLYREGPNDKVVGFLEVEDFGTDVEIPTGGGVDALAYLEGKSLARLLNAEKRATEYALVESKRPNFTIRFPKIDAWHIGAFINLWQITTAYAGRMLGIDAYDQPAVETGKKATFALMGRDGYDDLRRRVDETLA
ncbi:MAG: glucose-6-phosphate isomerase [Phycisphaerales bacterium]|nr:glucose-6-phosphate isomerase [Phycisphaerales bacterium]